jgi:hypothetical protein
MRRILILSLFYSILTACGGGGESSSGTTTGVTDPLNPTAITLDTPPSNGKLPAELLPPG